MTAEVLTQPTTDPNNLVATEPTAILVPNDVESAAILVPNDVEDDDVGDDVDNKPGVDVDAMLSELEDMADEFAQVVSHVNNLHENGFFKYLSKPYRNELLQGLLSGSDALEEASRATFRGLKRVKRVRVPDDLVDRLLAGTV